MRVEVHGHPGISRGCYEELIQTALELAQRPEMRRLSRWSWERFSAWLRVHPFEPDTGAAPLSQCTSACNPPQRMRRFPPTMNCWERALHELAWFAARGASFVSLYDHDLPQGRHIEVGTSPSTFLGAVANGPAEDALSGLKGALQGGIQGGIAGSVAGPYGALAGLLVGAVGGAIKNVQQGRQEAEAPTEKGTPDRVPEQPISPTLGRLLTKAMQRRDGKQKPSPKKRGKGGKRP